MPGCGHLPQERPEGPAHGARLPGHLPAALGQGKKRLEDIILKVVISVDLNSFKSDDYYADGRTEFQNVEILHSDFLNI